MVSIQIDYITILIFLRFFELLIHSHELDLCILVNVLPRVRVVGTIPNDFRATIKKKKCEYNVVIIIVI